MPSDKPSLLIRADASASIGTGHVMRCLALAQAWRHTGGDALFACAEMPPALRARVAAEGFDVQGLQAEPGTSADAEQTIRSARGVQAS